jgi:glucose/arabinose dehydrogenase
MPRVIALALASTVLTVLPPLANTPAAALSSTRVIGCRAAEPTCWPTAFAFTPDGDQVFYVERYTGQIRRHTVASGSETKWAQLTDVAVAGEQGVLGLALDPRWAGAPRYRWAYVYYTQASPVQNRIIRMRKLADGSLRIEELVTIPAGTSHNGGVIHIGPDRKLYAVTGDVTDPALAQQAESNAGKVLRMNLNGSRPSNNPIVGSLVYSFGHRNSFGFTFDPLTDDVWQTENGPECEDEVNRILPGGNYGWGLGSDCPGTSTSGQDPIAPVETYTPPIAITGAAFCNGCGLGGGAEGDLFVGAFKDRKIRRLNLNAARSDVTRQQEVYTHATGVLAVEAAPDGRLYFSDRTGINRLEVG